ncbi:hypothetical protein LX15_004053 [Streptoalloteichus tenebrarius]|uniref:Putative T7SS secretion signal domain-containing protein n=1 Tax=Streptoalloteichus tenebrarius (strain ATCC 17920 / DSM 40477 / JCM 4838 / CBS 697.72 / NBRC 16177 / NCIMB 11028 / NRRL B-12390 / A12253. 1 / ISP 5477) TaxID=1933 RepID=A0ABT1HXW7_STRSD|nr:hypothetical protein [Streptoalloteichus tenebrarius]MCP2260340.1 hypothetical protein [Streptoalloteichus tenebrarius]BFF03092.1 hypothetical protein GCM10020241_47670 [Streptoalloteichus tenebrarius]
MYGDPDKIDELARSLRAQAARAAEQASRVRDAVAAVHWEGQAAAAFRQRMAQRVKACETAQADLLAAAKAVEEHADEVRTLLAEINRLQEAVTGWVNSAIDTATGLARKAVDAVGKVVGAVEDHLPWKGWDFDPTKLPAPGHKDWLELGRRISEKGVAL